jgi:hypothetical protein
MMTDFWFNHFNVFFGKGIDRYFIADYEAKAIRPHVFGKFRDMLGATAKHPAMLFYLDNQQSVAPDSMRADVRLSGNRWSGSASCRVRSRKRRCAGAASLPSRSSASCRAMCRPPRASRAA